DEWALQSVVDDGERAVGGVHRADDVDVLRHVERALAFLCPRAVQWTVLKRPLPPPQAQQERLDLRADLSAVRGKDAVRATRDTHQLRAGDGVGCGLGP